MEDIRLSANIARAIATAMSPTLAGWTARQERRLRSQGTSLDAGQSEFAAGLGIHHPERVRVAIVPSVPVPAPSWLMALARRLGVPVFHPAGMALGAVVAVTRNDSAIIRHELVHVAQYARLGGHQPFMRRYIYECLRHGYRDAPLEQEARELSRTS